MTNDRAVDGALFHNLLLFGRLLHQLGLESNPGRMIEVQDALRHVRVGVRSDFYYTLRACLVMRCEDIPLFDEAFKLFWRKPSDGNWARDLNELFDDRRVQQQEREDPLQVLPQAAPDEEELPLDDEGDDPQEVIELIQTWSAGERLRQKDFELLTASEFAEIKKMMAALAWQVGERRTRRYTPGREGIVDMRRSLRQSLRHGGELLTWRRRTPKTKPRPLVVVADISGSMERYSRLLLHFAYGLSRGQTRRVEAFLFATRLTRITRQLHARDVDRALDDVTGKVEDWSGGTRIGEALKRFNYDWGRRVLRGGPVVLLISDGWDRGEPDLLNREMGRLRRSAHRVIWLNPLLGSAEYEPLTRGMQAALPYIDDFLPVHNLASLEVLIGHLNRLDDRRRLSRRPLAVSGAAFVDGRNE